MRTSFFNLRLYWSIFLSFLAIFLVFILPLGNADFKLSVLFSSWTIILNGIFVSSNLIFQRDLKFERSILASSVGSILVVPIVIFLSQIKSPIHFILLGSLLDWLVAATLSLMLLKDIYKFKLTNIPWSFAKEIIKEAWPISATLVLNVVYFRFDSFILTLTRNFSEVGIYNLGAVL